MVGVQRHEFQAPVRCGCWALSITDAAGAETLWSGPRVACSSPRASNMARRALLRAVVAAISWDEDLSAMPDRVSKPTAMMVRRIMSVSVTTKANPFCRRGFASEVGWDFMM